MDFVFENGSKFSGTLEDAQKVALALRTRLAGDYYYSNTLMRSVRVSDMTSQHLRNAILKAYRNWLDTLKTVPDRAFNEKLYGGPDSDVFRMLVKEQLRRS